MIRILLKFAGFCAFLGGFCWGLITIGGPY